jgi:hypothetical protein
MRLTDCIMAHAVAQQLPGSEAFIAYVEAEGERIPLPRMRGQLFPPKDRVVRIGHVDALTALRAIVESNPGPFVAALGIAA